MQSCELVTLITAIACTIGECYPDEQVELFGVIFTQLGDTLITISSANEICQSGGSSADPDIF